MPVSEVVSVSDAGHQRPGGGRADGKPGPGGQPVRGVPGQRRAVDACAHGRAGQGDAGIVPYVDMSMYVMTPEFGAQSQLEKIDMLDFADLVIIKTPTHMFCVSLTTWSAGAYSNETKTSFRTHRALLNG